MCKLIHVCLYRRGRVGQQSGSGVAVITHWIKNSGWLVDDICVGNADGQEIKHLSPAGVGCGKEMGLSDPL